MNFKQAVSPMSPGLFHAGLQDAIRLADDPDGEAGAVVAGSLDGQQAIGPVDVNERPFQVADGVQRIQGGDTAAQVGLVQQRRRLRTDTHDPKFFPASTVYTAN